MKHVNEATYTAKFFNALARASAGRRVLSIGGGVDRLGVELASQGRQVVCVDIAVGASRLTQDLADQVGMGANLQVVTGACEETDLPRESFDIVLAKRALHHMDLGRVLPRIHTSLRQGGVLLAEEPICLSRLLAWVHEKFPFYGDAPHTADEKELGLLELKVLQRTFSQTNLYYFDLLARESLGHFLGRLHCGGLLGWLGRIDFFLANQICPPLRRLCNYLVVLAVKKA